jgi:hypothetical protein
MKQNKMTKKAAIELVKEALNLKLNSKNTVLILINDDNKWMSKFEQEKKHQKLYILLNNSHSKKLHVFEIPANHLVYNLLYDKPFNENVFSLMFNVHDDEFIELFIHFNFKRFLNWSINYE